ncbi:MAG: hypothetical protein ACYTBJ_01865 [Planctomycetota bacterium]|jgi:hypothetical protein
MSRFHGGLKEMLQIRRGPATGRGWPLRGRYVGGAARFSEDPEAWCMTRHEAEEKIKRQGKVVLPKDS